MREARLAMSEARSGTTQAVEGPPPVRDACQAWLAKLPPELRSDPSVAAALEASFHAGASAQKDQDIWAILREGRKILAREPDSPTGPPTAFEALRRLYEHLQQGG